MLHCLSRSAFALAVLSALGGACVMDRAPLDLGRTPEGPGARVRFDLAHAPLPDIPLPNDVVTWADPTSRTGLRLNASLVASTRIERQARERFSQLEGWGTFAPITVSFDAEPKGDGRAAIDLAKVKARHRGDDYDFADDVIYLVNLETGVPVPLELGAGNYDYTLKKLAAYWPNDPHSTERNLLFETIDETQGGVITPDSFAPSDDLDFDGVLDRPNLDDPNACPPPDPSCIDPPTPPGTSGPPCIEQRQTRDRCVAEHLLTWYERETDTMIVRPLLPLDEMSRYAVVITDRLVDRDGNPVKSPFDLVYHASMASAAERTRDIVDDPRLSAYFGDIAGTGLGHVAFLWSFTTQPTTSDLMALRDGLYGQGPFARWATAYTPRIEVARAVGLTAGLTQGNKEDPGWETSPCRAMAPA